MQHEPTEVIFIGGRSGVGKTSVAFEASRILAQAEIRHAVIEGDNLDQAHPQPWRHGIDLAERNLTVMWANYRAIGYSRLIFTNTVSVLEIDTLSAALDGAVHAFGVLLTTDDASAAQRLTRRETGSGLEEHILRSAAAAIRLDAQSTAHRIDTTNRSVGEVAAQVLAAAGWT